MNIIGNKDLTDTPCVGICSTTNIGDDICKGCGRLAEEVIYWNTYSDEKKIEINKRILIEKRSVKVSKNIFNSIAEYSEKFPDEVYPGNLWKCERKGEWFLRWYAEKDEYGCCEIKERPIEVVDEYLDIPKFLRRGTD